MCVCRGRGGKVIALLDSWLLYGTSAYLFAAGKAFSIGTQVIIYYLSGLQEKGRDRFSSLSCNFLLENKKLRELDL